jgi:N4-gp56 family major capsid protein
MAIQTAAGSTPNIALTNAVTTRYTQRYQRGAGMRRLYDQLAMAVGAPQFELESRRGMGSTYTFNFLSEMAPGSTAISEITDITPQVLRDAVSTITPTSRGEALKWSELIDIEAYTDYVAARAEIVGMNAMETIDARARAAALQGDLVVRTVARASLDGASSTHRWSSDSLWDAASRIQALRCPPIMENGRPQWLAIAHPDIFKDLLVDGDVNSVALYQDKEILFNGELGQLAGFKLIISPWAKIFGGAGVDGSTNCDTTLSAALNALAVTATVGSSTGTAVGVYYTIGTEETAGTHYDDNEVVLNTTASASTTITFTGQAPNGGVRFDHASGAAVRNADNVYPVAYGSPQSLVKVFAQEVGAFGEVVGPKFDGLANQFQSLAWKWYGGYGLIAQNRLLRGEYSSSVQP